jgi:hypothetical protein
MAYLRKRPFSRLTYLAKSFTSIEVQLLSSIGANIMQNLVRCSRKKVRAEVEFADTNTFIFSKVRNFNTLQSASGSFDPSRIIQRDFFDMELVNGKETALQCSVEVFLLAERNKTTLAICEIAQPGRALMFPSFSQGDLILDKRSCTINSLIFICCPCSSPQKKVVLSSKDDDKVKSWKWKVADVFCSESPSPVTTEPTGLGISYEGGYHLLMPPPSNAELKRLSVPFTPPLMEQLRDFLTPEVEPVKLFQCSDDNKPAYKPIECPIPTLTTPQETRIKQAQQTRKQIEKDIMDREKNLIKSRANPCMSPTARALLHVDTSPSDSKQGPPPVVPLPTPVSAKRPFVQSSTEATSPFNDKRRPLQGGEPRTGRRSVVVTSMYCTAISDKDESRDLLPRSYSDNDNNFLPLPSIKESPSSERNGQERFGSPAIGDSDFSFKRGSKVSSGARFVRKLSGGLRNLFRKTEKFEFEILNASPPLQKEESYAIAKVFPSALCQESNNCTVESGSEFSISTRSLSRSNQSSFSSIQVDNVPDCSLQEFIKKSRCSDRVSLFKGYASISEWKEGSWVSGMNQSEMVDVSVDGEGAKLIAGTSERPTMELQLLPSYDIRQSTALDIQIKHVNRILMFRFRDAEQSEKFLSALQMLRNDVKSELHKSKSVPSLSDRDSSLGSISSALVREEPSFQRQQYPLKPPLISAKNRAIADAAPLTPPSTPPVQHSETELLLLNNLRCRLFGKDEGGRWKAEGQLCRMSVFSVPESASKSILVRELHKPGSPVFYERGMLSTAFKRMGKVGVSIAQSEGEDKLQWLVQFKGEKEAAYVHELLTSE